MPRNVYFQVQPRFTPGSPAMVSQEIAETVASQEKESYEMALTGSFGEDELELAKQEHPLRGIAESIQESKGGWNVTDLITGEKYWRGRIKPSKVQVGDRLLLNGLSGPRITITKPPQPFSGRLAGQVSLFGARPNGEGAYYHAFSNNETVQIERSHKEP